MKCFSNGVSRHTSMPWNFLRCATKNLKKHLKHLKTVLYKYVGLILDLCVPLNYLYQISLPKAQKG
jgi:hypothetical protein